MLSNHVKIQNAFHSTPRKSDLSQTFSEYFPGISLAEMLSNFSLPVSLGELKEVFSDEVGLHLKPVCCHLLFITRKFITPKPLHRYCKQNVLYTCCLLPKVCAVTGYSLHVTTHWLLFHMQRVIQKVAWLVQHQQITQVP